MSKITTPKNKKICSACGTSPVNHHLIFVSNILDEGVNRLNNFFLSKDGTNKWWKRMTDITEKVLFSFLRLVGLVRYGNNTEKARNGRSKLIWEEATRRNIPMKQLVMAGVHTDHFRANIKGKVFYFQSLPIPPWIREAGYNWVDSKFKLAQKLGEHSIPAPKTIQIRTLDQALKVFKVLKKPLIIKPENGSRGRHTTTNINMEEELRNAFILGKQISPWLVIQEHLFGSVYRATVIDGKLVGFFRADPPNVTGDGFQTISELISEKNSNRHERLSPISVSNETFDFLKRQNYTLESVLSPGVLVNLSAKTGRMYGGYTKEMLSGVHPKMHSIFEKVGNIIDTPVLGFDLIIEDPTKDPDTQNWGIIECNSLPFIDLHYFALEGEPIDLAKNVWDLWDKK